MPKPRLDLKAKIVQSGMRVTDIADRLKIRPNLLSQMLGGHVILKPEIEVLINAILDNKSNPVPGNGNFTSRHVM